MIHLHWETTASPEGDGVSPARDTVSPTEDLLASPNIGICDHGRAGEKISGGEGGNNIVSDPYKIFLSSLQQIFDFFLDPKRFC